MAKTDVVEGAEVEVEVDVEAEAAKSGKRGPGSVTYFGKGLESLPALDELPEQTAKERTTRGPSHQYLDMLTAVANDADRVGKWVPLAKFGTEGGARSVSNSLNKQVAGQVNVEGAEKVRGYLDPKQVRQIPEFEGWTWTFDHRRVANDDGTDGSVLYAKLVEVTI
jgi:hypothetical protein